MRASAKGILISLKSLKILWENAQPRIHQVQNPGIGTQQTHQVPNCATKAVLIVRVVSLSGAKMHRSESQAIFLKLREQVWIHFRHQFLYAACKGSYIFRQLNYIRASVYRILTVSNG